MPSSNHYGVVTYQSVKPTKALQRKRLVVDFVLDIETEDWDRFVCGCVLDVETDEIHEFRDEEDMARWVLNNEGTWWAHNGGRYDAIWFLQWVRKWQIQTRVFATSARITLLKTEEGVEIRDSAALIPLSLAKTAAIGGTVKLSVGLECRCTKACGGYCRIKRDMPESDFVAILLYCAQDCRAVAAALLALQDYADANDLDLCGTVGASAYRTAKRRLELKDAEWTARHYRLARCGYYGGRVQVFRPTSARGHLYDINSAYPAAIVETPLPTGSILEESGNGAERAFACGRAGIYQAMVSVPMDTFVPPLPCRDGKGRLRFPIGEFEGSWTELELRNAVDNGAEVLAWGTALIWPETTTLLADEVKRIWRMRADLGKEHPISGWLKFDANAFAGKFAQHPVNDIVVLGVENPKACPGDGQCHEVLCGSTSVGCCLHRCIGTCGAYEPLGWGQDAWIRREWKIPPNGHVQWAAYLTSAARVKLWKRLTHPDYRPIYCDTDSAPSETALAENTGTELGQWLDEGIYTDWTALAPKTYRYVNSKGKEIIKSKGIADPVWDDLVNRRETTMARGVNQFRTAIREEAKGKSFFGKKVTTRTLRYDGIHYGDRILDGEVTRPTTIKGETPWAT